MERNDFSREARKFQRFRFALSAAFVATIAGCKGDAQKTVPEIFDTGSQTSPAPTMERPRTSRFEFGKFEMEVFGFGSVKAEPRPGEKATLEEFLQSLHDKFPNLVVEKFLNDKQKNSTHVRFHQLSSTPYLQQNLPIRGAEFTANLDTNQHVTRVFGSMVPYIDFPKPDQKLPGRLPELPQNIREKYPTSQFASPGELVLVSAPPSERFSPNSFRPAYSFQSEPELSPGQDVRGPREVFVDALTHQEIFPQ